MNFFRSKSKSPSRSPKDGSFMKRSLSSRSQNREQSQPQYHNSNGLYPNPIQSNMDQPPAYTASPVSPSSPVAPGPMSTTSDSAYSFLTQFDTIFLIDDSGSMAGRSWRETAAALAAITPICTTYDSDGIDIYFLNNRSPFGAESGGAYTKVTTEGLVHEIFTSVSPRGGTPTGTRLNHILKPYLLRVEEMSKVNTSGNPDLGVRPLNIIVITDGVPTDDVESVIVNAARKLDALNAPPWQVGIQFFQVGNEPEAAEELRELDDNLSEQKGVRDMVDTVPWSADGSPGLTADGILKVVLGAVHKKYDRRSASGRRQRG